MLAYYGKKGNEVFLRNLTKNGITVTLKGEQRFPEWRSWGGLNGWVETLVERLGLTESQAFVELLCPKENLEWIETYPRKAVDAVHKHINPFTCENVQATIEMWFLEEYYKSPFSPKDLANHTSIFRHAHPKSYRDLGRLISMQEINQNPRILRMYYPMKLDKRSLNDCLAFALDKGVIKTKTVRLVSKAAYHMDLPMLKGLDISVINPDYWDGYMDIASLHKAGMPVKPLFPNGVTKREATMLMDRFGNYKPIKSAYHAELLPKIAEIRGYEIPNVWFYHIRTIEVLEWAARHIDQLSKSRTVYGPAGSSMQLHFHQLLEEIKPEMLVNGPKTAWRKVMSSIEELAKKKIDDALGKAVTFQCPKAIGKALQKFPEVKFLSTNVDLREEGTRMNHCVGGYVDACIKGRSQIFHVGQAAPAGSTIEIFHKDGSWILAQNYSKNDKNPSEKCVKIAKEFLAELNHKEVK